MEKNKTGKYLKYAIGEIVLVVIGILIALSINNWNESQIEHKELNGFLKKINNDILSDIKSAEEMLVFRDSSKYYSEKFFDIVKRNNLDMSDYQKVINPYYNPAYPVSLGSNKSGYMSLVNSGLLAKIDNPELAASIFDYYEQIKATERVETQIHDAILYENRELFGDVGTYELYDYLTNPKTITEEQKVWFRKYVKNIHLSNMHFRNIDDIGLSEGYKEIIKQGNHILELLNSRTDFKKD